ncbi:ABC transporter substrate-binding protein [Lacrimispora celerecrescens]|uniref:Oligogalacturonide transport system substrate-binding protein n=1 Tax=[Clostridium] celerecrescens 18A TaxID=1286362 RepID=A0A2M8Z5Z1_9FIRM|nr:ABC transporter substrate-binding protein [Lacrimispora celerecrescens]PJJ28851.1 oligogalacturonide transport system substrate-binding protein [[Clostridium] celerecrescens 18A]
MKKHFKKSAALFMAASMAAVSLMGCNSSAKNADTSAAAQSSAGAEDRSAGKPATGGEPVTLRFSWWGSDSRHKALLAVIEAYEKKNPNVKIEAEYQGYDGYYEKIMTTLSSNTAPDIIQLSKEWLPDIQGAKHYLADLSTLPVDLSTLKDRLLEIAGTYNGEPNVFPCTVGGSVIYVNTDFAKQYGIDLSKSYTWDEIKELGKSIHEQDSDAYLMTADADMLNRLFVQPYLAQKTGKPLIDEETYAMNFSEEDAAEAFRNIVDLYETNTLEPFGEAATFAGQADQNNKWINGKIGMIVDYTGSAPKYIASIDSPLDVISMPVTSDAKCSGVAYSGDRGFAVNDNSEHKEDAAKFLDFLMNDPESISICKTDVGYCPTKQSDDILIAAGVVSEIQKKGVEISEPNSYTNNMISGNTELEVTRKDLIQEVVYGDITPEEAAKELTEQYQTILDELKANK